ncbi:hypothetical protein EST38_g6217 [Candolleomyces aberdarensis]|uniref:Uncharacterized protein n=1 Tax=Candolleomyces aberdarensis TaxID=2316362 RepID=A0A4Q2DI42_9AGAR|nr:hypothetical protein EST38_g6217 [Candolleomyces aberdarensis]
MSADTDFEDLREQLRAKCIYLADDNVPERLEWFRMQDFDRVITKDEADKYRNSSRKEGTPSNEDDESGSPPPARLAGIVRLTHKHDFFMQACSGWIPSTSPGHPRFADIRPSAFTEDPGIPELMGDYPKIWNNVVALLRGWYQFEGEDATKLRDSVGVIDWTTKSEPNPAHGFKIGHRVFERQSPENLKNFQDHGASFNIETWPVEPEAQLELDKIKKTHIAHPIPVYYPDPEKNLIPPYRYRDDLRGAIVRLEFHLNHWFIDGRHTFTADIRRMKILVRPNLPPRDVASPIKRKGIPSRDDFSDEDELPRPPKRQATSHRTNASASTSQQNPQAVPSTPKKTKATSTRKTAAKDKSEESPKKEKYKQSTLHTMWSPK